MSASEKLKALDGGLRSPESDTVAMHKLFDLADALPQIVAVVEAAEEPAREIISDSLVPAGDDWRPRFPKLEAALAALDEALK